VKTDGQLASNPLNGTLGDVLHTLFCAARQNFRLLFKILRLNYACIVFAINAGKAVNHCPHKMTIAEIEVVKDRLNNDLKRTAINSTRNLSKLLSL
jgi:transposase, IS5 family